ncbi:hypothetical protein BCR39DRAFT_82834 [Naematelia encephala]|uniref:DNA-binding protein n=1 Tax=Naematelia encephala TaxID=71784 RepID=A0A1Y2ADH7_9TREE|nr:hypothetical protein BCR39DRAFT_82834 [Naematelia encephala]
MVKDSAEVVKEFNEIVNMTADELDAFLKTEASTSTGWSKDDGSGESIGHESGRKIVDILHRNPDKDPSKYTEQDKEHMRKVVSYCKRHLAQEEHMKQEKTPEELEKTKSTRSLKNWGHDPMKTIKSKPASKGKPVSKAKPASKGKPVSKGKPISEGKPVSKAKPSSKGKPVSKKAANHDKADKVDEVEKDDKVELGKKRQSEPASKTDKPASKKTKTQNPPSEATRKPPSRGAKAQQA